MILLTENGPVNFEVLDHIEARRAASPERREQMDRAVETGQLLTDYGEQLDPDTERRVRTRLLDRFGHLQQVPAFHEYARQRPESSRWLIPGLWPEDTIPMLSGNHKAGKTTLIADLAASLVVPGKKFLGRYGPVNWGREIPDVYLINAETPRSAMIDALYAAGVEDENEGLVIEDLEDLGAADLFDLTDPLKYDLWRNRLVYCERCDGNDDGSPKVVIVDGMTAILGGSTDRYAEWYAAFRRLMREIDVPNALCTGHTTMSGTHSMGGVEMLGGPDGLWTYWSADPDSPTSRRYFQVQPRLGGAVVPRTEVQMNDGRLIAAEQASTSSKPPTGGSPVHEEPSPRDEVLEMLERAGPEGLRTTPLTGSGRVGQLRREALNALHAEGIVCSRSEGRGDRWWIAEHSPAEQDR